MNSFSTVQILVQAPAEFVRFSFSLVTRQGMSVADESFEKYFGKGSLLQLLYFVNGNMA